MNLTQRFKSTLFLLQFSKTKSTPFIFTFSFFIRKLKMKIPKLLLNKKQLYELSDKSKIITSIIDGAGLNQIYKNKIYELIPHFRPKYNSIIVDVGAFVGAYSIRSAKIAKKGVVISVEPSPKSFNLLKNNIKINHLKNIIPINFALSNFNGRAKLYTSNDNPASNSIYFKRQSYVEVGVKKLDDLLAELSIERIDILKIDAEGSELDILRGSKKTLKNKNLKIVISLHDQVNYEKIKYLLKKNEFSTKLIRKFRETLLYAQRGV